MLYSRTLSYLVEIEAKNVSIVFHLCTYVNLFTGFPLFFVQEIPGLFKGFLHFFKVSLNIPNEVRDSQNQSLNINWTGIAYYILSTLHVHVCHSYYRRDGIENLIHCSTIRLALRPAPSTTSTPYIYDRNCLLYIEHLTCNVCLVGPLWFITVYLFIPTLILPTFYFSFAFFLCIDVSMNELRT
jgi:hypothetical protein